MWKQALVVSAHSDDGIIGCGGTIARLLEAGVPVSYLYFVLPPKENRQPSSKEEIDNALKVLGITDVMYCELSQERYLNTILHEYRQEILTELVWIYRGLRPDLVFTLSTDDTHQDHAVVSAETFRACKKSTILGYDFHWNTRDSHLNCCVPLGQTHIEKKVMAVQEHISQLFRPFLSREAITGLAQTRGAAIDKRYAEAFEVIRWVW